MKAKVAIPECLRPLSDEDLAKINPITKEEIEEALRQGREEAQAFMKSQSSLRSSGIRYK